MVAKLIVFFDSRRKAFFVGVLAWVVGGFFVCSYVIHV